MVTIQLFTENKTSIDKCDLKSDIHEAGCLFRPNSRNSREKRTEKEKGEKNNKNPKMNRLVPSKIQQQFPPGRHQSAADSSTSTTKISWCGRHYSR